MLVLLLCPPLRNGEALNRKVSAAAQGLLGSFTLNTLRLQVSGGARRRIYAAHPKSSPNRTRLTDLIEDSTRHHCANYRNPQESYPDAKESVQESYEIESDSINFVGYALGAVMAE